MSVGGPQLDIAHGQCECTCYPPKWPRWNDALDRLEHSPDCLAWEPGPKAPPAQPKTQWSTREVLVGIACTLEEILAELRHSSSVDRTGAVSSLQIEDNPTKDRVVRVTSKSYTGSVLPVEEALEAHGRAHREAEARARDGWAETLAAVAEAKNGAEHG
jgi:hypothetical protein